MFEQFRRHFPKGSLISELVQIDHGKYIVRALVQNDGLTLATGLAAAETVEQAEDKARSRALAVLDISLAPAMTKADAQPTASSTYSNQGNVSPPAETTPAATQQHDETSVSSVTSFDAQSYGFVSSPQSSPQSPTTTQTETQQQETASVATKTPSPSSESATEPSSQSSSTDYTSMDYSDIIARTNVELKRLQWTNEQGRKFLEQTYGKRSRQLLSEQELLEFLQYLEKQPTPTDNDTETE